MGDPESEKPRRRFSRVWKDFLRTLSVKFLREKVCRPESWEFLGLQGDQGVIKPMGTVWKGI